jgi:fido (protein-threonine AMPylation protein)
MTGDYDRRVATGFEGFRDSPEAPFYCSAGMSAEDTWLAAADRLRQVLADVEDEARYRPMAMTGERICRWHRAIFSTTFARDAGRIRTDNEPVWFVVRVGSRLVEGTRGRRSVEGRRAATPATEAIGVAAALYGDLLRIHPFVDGNLRAAFVALQAGLRSLGLPGVSFGRVLDRHDRRNRMGDPRRPAQHRRATHGPAGGVDVGMNNADSIAVIPKGCGTLAACLSATSTASSPTAPT